MEAERRGFREKILTSTGAATSMEAGASVGSEKPSSRSGSVDQ